MDTLWLLAVAILVLIVVSALWQVFGVSALFATLSPTQRLLVALLGLVLIIAVLWWFFSHAMIGVLP